ncbi:hypothetical protein BD311DRAFT_849895 [Dichomitus squalens]|uniref:DUF8212 domain-containing protein n=1 Tax=Dichomitus squalens TaxID=114155 RepID=A0A4Q9MG13_9APHY|nr:hypothetical protein BD311DRAFT_849895 [Dichomitus squalens]
MYQWYAYAEVCYAYLSDVPSDEDPRAWLYRFRRSRWYERGWTLQELIATLTVTFLSKDWKVIGSKHSLSDIVEEITGIPEEALLHTRALDSFSVAQRRTTRVEDRAYSLLGIFDINMPTLYGEGERAFRRLQEEILRRIPDQSLFAWSNMYSGYVKPKALITSPSKQHWQTGYFCCGTYRDTNCLFGSSPEAFMAAGDIGSISYAALSRLQLSSFLPTEYTPTPQGIRTQMPVIPLSLYLPQNATEYPAELPPSRWYLAILGCEHYDFSGSVLGRVCYLPPSESGIDVLYPGRVGISPKPKHGDDQADLFPLSLDTIERCREQIQLKTVYISHPRRVTVDRHHDLRQPHNCISLMLPKETRRSLLVQGYRATIRGPDQDHPNSHWLVLSSYARTLTIEYQHTLKNDGYDLAISAQVQMHIYSLGSDPISVTWADATPWAPSLSTHEVAVSHGLEDTLTVKLGLGFVMPSHYSLFVEVGGEESTFAASLSRRLLRQDRLVLDRDNGTSVRDGEEEGRVDQVNYYEDTDEDVNVTKSPV